MESTKWTCQPSACMRSRSLIRGHDTKWGSARIRGTAAATLRGLSGYFPANATVAGLFQHAEHVAVANDQYLHGAVGAKVLMESFRQAVDAECVARAQVVGHQVQQSFLLANKAVG